MMIQFEIPGYCQPKQRTFGKFITPPKTRAYEKLVGQYAKSAMMGRAPLEGFCDLEIKIFCSIPKSFNKKKLALINGRKLWPTHCDIDNQIKAVSDAINKIIFTDDRFVKKIIATRIYSDKEYVCVTISW